MLRFKNAYIAADFDSLKTILKYTKYITLDICICEVELTKIKIYTLP